MPVCSIYPDGPRIYEDQSFSYSRSRSQFGRLFESSITRACYYAHHRYQSSVWKPRTGQIITTTHHVHEGLHSTLSCVSEALAQSLQSVYPSLWHEREGAFRSTVDRRRHFRQFGSSHGLIYYLISSPASSIQMAVQTVNSSKGVLQAAACLERSIRRFALL